jgi:hypothetical protein
MLILLILNIGLYLNIIKQKMALNTEIDLERKQPLQGKEGWRLQFTVDTYRAIIDDLKSATDEGVTSVLATGGTQGGGTGDVSISLTNTGVTPGTYTSANITVDEQGRISFASDGSAAASAGTSNEHQVTDNAGGFVTSILQETGGQIGVGGVTTSAVFALDSVTDKGFTLPTMTVAQRTAIASPIAGLQVHTEDGTDSIPYYNHSVDGWIPVGRYAGNPQNVAGSKNGQLMGSNLDGELVPIRLVGSGSFIYPTNSSGNYATNSVNLGSTNYNFLYGYFNRTYVNQIWIGGTATGVITATSGTGGGIRFSSNSGAITNNLMKLHGETAYKGLSVRDTDIASADRIEATAVMELQSTTRGFLPPRMTTVEMNTIATPATGLMIYDETTNQWMGYNGTSWRLG